MQCLRVGLHGLGETGQRLARGLGKHPHMQQCELLKLADVAAQIPILRAVVVDKRHCCRW
jgi:hypothetical protein